MRRIRDIRDWDRKAHLVNGTALRKVLLSFKGLIPRRYKHRIKNILFYYYVIVGRFNPIKLQKICG